MCFLDQRSPTPPQRPRYSGQGSQQRQWASGNGFSIENKYWDDSDQGGHGDMYGFHDRRGIGATRYGQQLQYGTQEYGYQGNLESQVANAIIYAFQNLNFDVKINVPDFDGKSNADGFIDWLNRVDKMLAFKKCTGKRAVTLDKMILFSPQSLSEIVEMARRVEAKLKPLRYPSFTTPTTVTTTPISTVPAVGGQSIEDKTYET
ncbi:hypothetical protein GIB67_040346 [Kingdonia uniflora]|uniref:Uncharacterized protein n=1 Tax=Kingdonia uniflora TaxID=39325 RepID=A0A7J7L9G2_9MAGN|nr:hypothetical protein GIB67_040346 [Kingdonia uniflora]